MLTAYYDGSCPLCSHSMAALYRRAGPTRLTLIDAADATFEPASIGQHREHLMETLHVYTDDAQWLTGVDAVHAVFCSAGLGWLAWPLRIKPLRALWMAGYACVANNRYRISSKLHIDCPGSCSVRKWERPTESSTERE
ncbi:thiol-disulfide oxidoreductase DCC family protein [Andreprevotia chitinilytica]|uniref:thiol-disulfide oxidoreductase DCC family protein n=1 Tax=Andreprevotia chitinilytica TaxID=396808 RepID=UPI000689EAD2|nr:DUF393 domain-containing protein [Andreprevotia chitinilytica]